MNISQSQFLINKRRIKRRIKKKKESEEGCYHCSGAFKGSEELVLDIDDVLSQHTFPNIKLALYKINKINSELPFLEFILFKNLNNYSFLNFINFNTIDCDSNSLKKFIISQLKKCIEIENYNKLSIDNLDFKGFKYYNNELY